MEKIKIKTADGVELSSLFWNNDGFTSVILLHAMPVAKESWIPLADSLSGAGHNVLAFDFRGHGESEGGDYTKFVHADHQKYLQDLEAAAQYLKAAFPHTELYVVGASIGANIALQYMSEHHDLPKTVALSAGLNYHGVNAEDFVQNLEVSQAVLFIAAEDDKDVAQQTAKLFELTASMKEKIICPTGGHGATILETRPELVTIIEEFLM